MSQEYISSWVPPAPLCSFLQEIYRERKGELGTASIIFKGRETWHDYLATLVCTEYKETEREQKTERNFTEIKVQFYYVDSGVE